MNQKFEIELLESEIKRSGERIVSIPVAMGSIGENKYEMRLVDMNKMAIYSHQTGKAFVMEWSDVCGIAIAAGIDEPTPEGGEQ